MSPAAQPDHCDRVRIGQPALADLGRHMPVLMGYLFGYVSC